MNARTSNATALAFRLLFAALFATALFAKSNLAEAQCSTGACPPCEGCRVRSAAGSNPSTADMATLFNRIATGPRTYGSLGWNFGGADTLGAGAGCCDGSSATPCPSVAATFPCLLLKAIYYTESGWRQFCTTGRTVIAFDCGYGIAQVTSGMRPGDTSSFDPNRVAGEAAYNVSVGAAILAGKWRIGACVGSNDPTIVEHWYFATWGYNGFATKNNPNNPMYRADRPEFNSSATARTRGNYPYQELVWGYAHYSPSTAHWTGQQLGYPRRSEICASCGFPMANVSEPSVRTPAACNSAPVGPRFGAQFVSQSFPVAATTLDLAAGAQRAGFIELRNIGTDTWRPGEIFLGTTQPRDRSSMARGSDWVSANRAATIDRVVAPGATGRFNFSLRAPNTLGQEFSEYFGVLREGVSWFSEAGQGGPPDNQLQVRVRAVSAAAMDAGVADAMVALDSSTPFDANAGDVSTPRDGTAATDSALRDASADSRRVTPEMPGCGCTIPGKNPSNSGQSLALAAALTAVAFSRRRRR
ncbi:MAG: MYXO-CTERM sorting domain-containing protein [Deltaproteobacteria bacterium]|nr:MYXO-CTERM sorting domain-containing protein [Deltaproteobacteria bacterium]